ncbi:ADP-ribosyltransferase domain-containing protein [Rhizobium sp. C4]|uniref:ADP-ribosyltransferase domain-containing protein n=1 Tax=Rhizobium sp. C4 TaxID=1349800 RepID=UPI001E2F5EC9|nr:ADP-ribosyltransferase domain-containing protein [Rhizobium sp. C4]MCD2171805.1 hypothetical protein [Rhizobium sp. C4]
MQISSVAPCLIALLDYDGFYEVQTSAGLAQALEAGRDFNLTDEEIVCLHVYTLDDVLGRQPFQTVNRILREGDSFAIEEIKPFVTAIATGAQKLPLFSGWAMRRIFLPPEIGMQLDKIETFQEFGFLSASRTDPKAFAGDTTMMILSRRGRIIGPVSEFPNEDEVLFLPGTRFEVMQHVSDGKRRVIFLKEI